MARNRPEAPLHRPPNRRGPPALPVKMLRRALHIFSHLAVWPGMYVAAAVAYAAQVLAIPLRASAWGVMLVFAFLTAAGVYLIDRVKVRDEWLDPADAAAHPARDAFVRERARVLRVLAGVLLLTASALGLLLPGSGKVLAAAPLLALAGVVLYAGRPKRERARPKDVLIVKNLYIAGGITAFACGLTVLACSQTNPGAARDPVDAAGVRASPALVERWPALVAGQISEAASFLEAHSGALSLIAATLLVRVFADAALCDLDDQHADRDFGTHTLATRYGREPAWNLGMAARLVSAAALVAVPLGPPTPRLAWAGVTVVSSIWLRVAAPRHVRDWVDARFALEAACVAVMTAMTT